ncbi:hypothetical protein [Streptomyces silaceus]|uniref:hypothetical protein n=1 Tax=Streptomyces silaceus TaxID=545123 RepID=UPI000AD084DD|nr:hypothetical protein [Streptomyces silaceus]
MPTQQVRTTSVAAGSSEHGVTATVLTVLRRHRRILASATARVVGLSGLVGLLMTAAIFALAWPVFTHMRNQRIWYHHLENPYLHDHMDLALVAVWTLPLFLVPLGIGSAALQSVCSQAFAAGTEGPPQADRSRATTLARLRPVLAAYALRGLIVWPLPLLAAAVARAGTVRVLALAVPLFALTAGLLRLVTQLALPLRPLVRALLEGATGNFFAAYYAGILAPVVGILVAAAVTLPLAFTAFAVLHEHLRSPRVPRSNWPCTARICAM